MYSMCTVCVQYVYTMNSCTTSTHCPRLVTYVCLQCLRVYVYCTVQCLTVQGYTISKVTQCPKLHNVQSYTMSKVTQCPRLYNVQGYTLSIKCTSSQCPRRDNVNVCQMTMLMSILNIGPHVRSVHEYTMYCLTCEMPSSEKAEMVLSRFRPILALLVMALQTELVPPCGRDYLVNQ